MIRDSLETREFFNKWIEFQVADIADRKKTIARPSGNPSYRPQYVFELAREHWHMLLLLYSRGDPIHDLAQYFPPILDAWEEAERLGKDVWTERQQYTRHAWAVNLDHYIICFWLLGLALALDIPDDQWQRLLALIGNEGEDELLDRIIATRQPGRQIGSKLCHPKPYQRLLDAINAPADKQPKLLFTFVDKWYAELNRPPKKGLSEDAALYERPYWYKYHTVDGGYFGYWCVEAVAAAKAFDLDDSLCLGHPNYPGDLLRSDGPSTHPERSADDTAETAVASPDSPPKTRWLARLFRKR